MVQVIVSRINKYDDFGFIVNNFEEAKDLMDALMKTVASETLVFEISAAEVEREDK